MTDEERIKNFTQDGILEGLSGLFNEDAKTLSLSQIFNGKEANKNPLNGIPDSEMKLYGVFNTYFATKEELKIHCESEGIPMTKSFTLEYLRSFAGRSDVIKKMYEDGRDRFYTFADEYGYGIYNYERSIYRGEFIWEYSEG